MFTKKKPLEIKKQTVSVPVTQTSRPSPTAKDTVKPVDKSRSSSLATKNGTKTKSQLPSSIKSISAKRKRPIPRPSNLPDFGTSDESDDEHNDNSREQDAKRRKQKQVRSLYKERQMCSSTAFVDGKGISPNLHAAQISSLDNGTKYEPYFPGLPKGYEVSLQYPSLCRQERYELARAPHDSQGYDPIHDMTEVMHKVIEFYIPEQSRLKFSNESTGYPQRLYRAVKKRSQTDIQGILGEWNDIILHLIKDETITTMLHKMLRPDPRLVEWIINQTHARTVSLNLKALHEYEAGTDNVYGELLPKFVSKILEDTMLGPKEVFVDLGSGVGNVVLQAALEAGCESWGCEMMEKYCDVAELQQEEFAARCEQWGLRIGDIHLERGDFLANSQIHQALRRADVVLVNNQVFTPQTNDALTTLFLDLKDGCRIVSLKSFVPAGHRINVRNSQSPYSILGDIKEKEYFSKSVSWTDQGGKYFISTKDQSYLTQYNTNGT